MPVSRKLAAVVLAFGCAAVPERTPAAATKIDIRADDIAFYPYANETLVAAEGHVVVRVGSRRIEAGALRYDLGRNRLTATDDVRVVRGQGTLTGNAYTLDVGTGKAVLMRLDPVPATYGVRGDDFGSAVEMPAPAGTFAAIDLDGQRPYMRSKHAIVSPGGAIRMTPAAFPTSAGFVVTLPTYVYTLVSNAYITQSAAPAASFDQPYTLAGTPNSLTTANLRYDAQNGITFGLDEHLVDGQRAYVATSILPFRDRQFDITAYDVIRKGLQQTFTATKTLGRYQTTDMTYRLQESGALTIETLTASVFDASNTAEFDLSTYAHDVGNYFSYQLHGGFGHDHNYAGYPYANDFRTTAGGFVESPSVKVFGSSINAKYDYTLTAYDYPHEVTDGTTTFTIARSLRRGISALATIEYEQNDNRYRFVKTGAVALGLPGPSSPYYAPDGTLYPGYYAFAGLNTYRTYQLATTFQGRGDNRIVVTLTHTRDFPQYHGLGRPPLDLDVDVKERITPTLAAEIARSYNFGWGGQYLSPEYYFAISP
jgi:hypothetical protein